MIARLVGHVIVGCIAGVALLMCLAVLPPTDEFKAIFAVINRPGQLIGERLFEDQDPRMFLADVFYWAFLGATGSVCIFLVRWVGSQRVRKRGQGQKRGKDKGT